MARGWESKSVEAQIEENKSSHPLLGNVNQPPSQEVEAKQQKANLLLSRKRILEQLASSTSPRYTEMLQHSLADLDSQLAAH